jgi:hypothetical protein
MLKALQRQSIFSFLGEASWRFSKRSLTKNKNKKKLNAKQALR